MQSAPGNYFEAEHARIGEWLQMHLLDLVGADFSSALHHFAAGSTS